MARYFRRSECGRARRSRGRMARTRRAAAWSGPRCAVESSPGRAAWLVAACPPTVAANGLAVDAPNVGVDTPPNRVGGFPPRLQVWVAFGAGVPSLLDEFDVDRDSLVFDVIGARAANANTTEVTHAKDRWWVSWPAAQEVGLGRIIPLPAGRQPADIRTLYVVGLSEEGPADHFRAQIDAGELATLPLGAPTNAVDGAQAANLAHDASDWRTVARNRLRQRQSGAVVETDLTRSLAGLGADLPAMPAPDSMPGLQDALVNALWPVLWGHKLRDIWGCVEESDRLAGWARRYLRPEGPLPPIRIDQQPYALLPTSALSQWKVSGEEGPLAQFEERVNPAMTTMRAHWAAAARGHGTAVGADTQHLLDLIARDAVSASYAYRPFLANSVVGIALHEHRRISTSAHMTTGFAPRFSRSTTFCSAVRRGPRAFVTTRRSTRTTISLSPWSYRINGRDHSMPSTLAVPLSSTSTAAQ